MIYRKAISDKLLDGLKKVKSIPKVAWPNYYSSTAFSLQCDKVREVIEKAGYSVSEKKSCENADQILIRVILYREGREAFGVGLTIQTYAIVHTVNWLGMKRKHIFTLDKCGNIRKIKKIPDKIFILNIETNAIEENEILRTKNISFCV